MTAPPDRLAELLPRHIRTVDAAAGGPLRALLAVIGEQVALSTDAVDELAESWFIETCPDSAVAAIGDLISYRRLGGFAEALAAGGEAAQRLAARLAPRADVAATVGNRRRKGTLPLLKDLARTAAAWPARAIEERRLVTVTVPVRTGQYPLEARGAAPAGGYLDLRDGSALALLGTPFEAAGHLADARGITAEVRGRPAARASWPAVTLAVWRRQARSVTHAPAYCIDRARNLFTFSILGNDVPLVADPEPEPGPSHLAGPGQVPDRLRRRWTQDHLAEVYGPGRSFAIWRDAAAEPVPLGALVVADLSGWAYRPRRDQVAVDPERGRIAFGGRHAPRGGVWVTYHEEQADDLGGGEYPRTRPPLPPDGVYRVGAGADFTRIADAFARWQADRDGGGPASAIIEIVDSGAYQEQLDLAVGPGERLELRAAEGTRPVLRLLDWYSNRPDALQVRGLPPEERQPDLPGPVVVLDGLLITGRGVSVTGPVTAVVLRHCTLVPGWSLDERCGPAHPEEPSLLLEDTGACVQIERSILGTILVIGDEVRTDPLDIHLTDSVLDATAPGLQALSAPDCRHAHAVLHARRSTVIGEVHAEAVALGENSIFHGTVHVARRSTGCLRFSYLTPGGRTPRRYHCEPDTAAGLLRERAARGELPAADLPGLVERAQARIRPRFAATKYGVPGYAELDRRAAPELLRGADDGSQLGVFHDLFEPQREDNLRARLQEFSPAGTETGLIFVS